MLNVHKTNAILTTVRESVIDVLICHYVLICPSVFIAQSLPYISLMPGSQYSLIFNLLFKFYLSWSGACLSTKMA